MNLDDEHMENELRAALRREEPSPGFAQRVVARATSKTAPRSWFPGLVWVTALAAMLVIGFTTAYEYRQMKAERASHDAVIALRIASEKLNLARDKALRREN